MESRSRFKSKGCALCGYAQEPRLDLYRPILPKHSPNMTVRRENGKWDRNKIIFPVNNAPVSPFLVAPLVRSFVVKRREEDCLYDDTGRQDLTAVARGEGGRLGRGRRKKDGGGGGSTNAMELCGGAFHPSIHDARSRFEGEPARWRQEGRQPGEPDGGEEGGAAEGE